MAKEFDPPNGYRYGFPKEIPADVLTEEDFKEWLKEEGYPVDDIEYAIEYGRCIYD